MASKYKSNKIYLKMEDKKWSTGAWKKQTQKGEVINFTINGVKYSMWQNTYKKDEKQPDFKIVVNDFKPKDELQAEKNDLPF